MWVILYLRGGRIASFPIGDKGQLQKTFYYTLIAIDYNNTEHWEILGIRKENI